MLFETKPPLALLITIGSDCDPAGMLLTSTLGLNNEMSPLYNHDSLFGRLSDGLLVSIGLLISCNFDRELSSPLAKLVWSRTVTSPLLT